MTDTSKLITEIPFGFPGKIFRSPMPFSTYDRLGQIWQLYWQNGIRTIVVMTESQEYLVHARRDLPKFYRAEGLDVIHIPIPDFQAPMEPALLEDAVTEVIQRLQKGENIAVHCMAGIGRTGIFMACMAKRVLNLDGYDAIDWVRRFIPDALENLEQEQFVFDF